MADLSTTKLVDVELLKKYNTKVQSDYNTKIGTLTNLTTTAKTSTVAAVNELDGEIGDLSTVTVETASGVKATTVVAALNQLEKEVNAGGSGSIVTVDTTTTTTGALKSYTFYQGDSSKDENKIATIDIPKDFLVKSGSIVKDPAGQTAGTYLALVINTKDGSGTDETVYINVADLVDAYTAAASATEVQVAISSTNEVSATLVDGGVAEAKIAGGAVTVGKLADNAVETVKIKDANVTASKLAENSVTATQDGSTKVITSTILDDVIVAALNSAVTAVQASNINVATESDMLKDIFGEE